MESLGEFSEILTGAIFPKFDACHAEEYCEFIKNVNAGRKNLFYFMPILETKSVMDVNLRFNMLNFIKNLLDKYKKYVLNIRVGGLDFCNLYGLRRTINQTIYDIGIVRNVLVDILTVFSEEYVVSAPCWEYFGSPFSRGEWAEGLAREIELDIANGFIGKTAVHPDQLELIHNSMKPSLTDFQDAMQIINWNDKILGVAKTQSSFRMNELKVQSKWARKILSLSEIYGVSDNLKCL